MKNDDLISRAALVEDLSYCAPELFFDRDYLLHKIMRQPVIDAVPVVHGTWGRYYDEDHCTEYIVCSNCGAEYDSDIVFAYHKGESRLELEGLEHCPHCGFIMDGGDING